jgi:predicted phosphodiesterase
MRYAILSDIHANLEAFRAVLARTAELGTDRVICLGDIVGYYADPNACVDLVRSEGVICILGNHDAVACGIEEPDVFNLEARTAILWTRERLLPENRSFLSGLPRVMQIDDMFLCHGSISDTNRYLLYDSDARENFALMVELPGRPLTCFFGHTHARAAYSLAGPVLAQELGDAILLSSNKRYLINPGSVGQPRDNDPRAAFIIYDAQERTVVFHRVGYDIASCRDKILRASLPTRLAERLMTGR